jgi:hypothetical protein
MPQLNEHSHSYEQRQYGGNDRLTFAMNQAKNSAMTGAWSDGRSEARGNGSI